MGEFWNCVNDEVHNITEFHGSGRARYMTRQRDPDAVNFILPGTTRWSDYDDDVIYGDYVVDEDTGDITNTTAYLPGIAQMNTQTGNVMYLHSDQIGSLRAVSTEYGEPIQRMVYTSFGEKVHEDGTVGTRYQYAGEWGYQSSEDLPFVHVGHRYYDPSTGRFLQRDPIGINGGLNVYAYVCNRPADKVDPMGLVSIGIGLEGEFVGFGFSGSANVSLHGAWSRSNGFSCAPMITISIGTGIGIYGGVNVVTTGSTAPRVSDLGGLGASIGFSGGAGIGAGGSLFLNAPPVAGVTGTLGAGIGAGFPMQVTYTKVITSKKKHPWWLIMWPRPISWPR